MGLIAVLQTDCVLCEAQSESLYIIEISVFNGLKAFTKHEQERQCAYKRTTAARSRNHFCHGKAIIVKYSERVSLD